MCRYFVSSQPGDKDDTKTNSVDIRVTPDVFSFIIIKAERVILSGTGC